MLISQQQKERLKERGFMFDQGSGAEAVDIDWIWKSWIEKQEKERVEGVEWMDEVEEFVLLAQHYCIAYGWRGFDDDEGWRGLAVPQ